MSDLDLSDIAAWVMVIISITGWLAAYRAQLSIYKLQQKDMALSRLESSIKELVHISLAYWGGEEPSEGPHGVQAALDKVLLDSKYLAKLLNKGTPDQKHKGLRQATTLDIINYDRKQRILIYANNLTSHYHKLL